MGRLLANGSKTIGVMMGNQRGGFIEKTWEALASAARASGCNLLVLPGELDLYTGAKGDRYDEAYAFVRAGNLDGVIAIAGNINFENRHVAFLSPDGAQRPGFPLSVLGREMPGVPSVLMDGEAGVREAIHHFIDHHGFMRIGFVRGRAGHPHAESRYRAYVEALASRDIPVDDSLVYPGNFGFASGRKAIRQILGDGLERMDALFACNDDLALGILRGLHGQGLSVPGDMRLIGFDDSCESQAGLTHVSSVRQPIREMAEWALRAVLDPGSTGTEMLKRFPSKLIIRESCGCTATLRLFACATGKSGGWEEGCKAFERHCPWIFQRSEKRNDHGPSGRDAFAETLRSLSVSLVTGLDLEMHAGLLENWLVRLVQPDDDMADWDQVLGWMRALMTEVDDEKACARAQGIFLHLHASVQETRGNKRRIARFRSNYTQSLRSESLLALAAADRLDGLRSVLEKQLPDLGMTRYLLSLFVEPDVDPSGMDRQEAESAREGSRAGSVSFPLRLVPVEGFTGDDMPPFSRILFSMGMGLSEEPQGWREYPTLDILPEGHAFVGERMDLMVEPLFFGSEQYGFQVCELGPYGESLYETFRPQIATSLHTIGLIRRLQQTLEELQRTQRQLVQSEKMASLGTLVAGFAHELNTPVGIGVTAASFLHQRMETFFDRMDKQDLSPDELVKFRREALSSVSLLLGNLGKASELVASFKRVAADQASEQRRSFLLKQYLHQILSSLHPRLQRLLPEVEVVCPEELSVDTYPGALFQVLSNLLLNSVMHAFPDDRPGRARIVARRVGRDVALRYEDNGIGIPEALWEKVFDPFNTTARSKGGTGIGLHSVYNAVTQLLGGSITCGRSDWEAPGLT